MEGNRYKRGHWSLEEDKILMDYISIHGKGRWNRIAKATGLKRCGKSCRLRWMNYLSPTIKKGNFSQEEDDLIIRLHKLLGNRWSLIAGRIPGRTDNQVKNHWNTHLSKRLRAGKNISNEAESSLPSSSQDSVHGGEKLNVCQKEVARSPKQLVDGTGAAATNEEELIQQHQQPLQVLDEARSIDRSLSSIWVANSDRNLDMIPSLVELLDGFPLDILWHDF